MPSSSSPRPWFLLALKFLLFTCASAVSLDHFPDCLIHPSFGSLLGNGECLNEEPYNTEECGYDGGDCIAFNDKYPDCTARFADTIGDGNCLNYGAYNTEACKQSYSSIIFKHASPIIPHFLTSYVRRSLISSRWLRWRRLFELWHGISG